MDVEIGVVPMPPPVPMYMTHIPQASPAEKSTSLRAMVLAVLAVAGSPSVFAKLGPQLQVP